MGVIYGIALCAADSVGVMAHIAFFVFIKMPGMLKGIVTVQTVVGMAFKAQGKSGLVEVGKPPVVIPSFQ